MSTQKVIYGEPHVQFWLLATRYSHGLQKWVPDKRSLRNSLDVVVVETPGRCIQNQNMTICTLELYSTFRKSTDQLS